MTFDLHKQDIERYLKKSSISEKWKKWIRTNLKAGCDKNAMFKIMYDEGLDYNVIKDALNFEPSVSVEKIINPLKRRQNDNYSITCLPFIPNAERLDHTEIELYIVDDFLNKQECVALLDKVGTALTPSVLANKELTDYGSACDIGQIKSYVIHDLNRRICSITGLSVSHSDNLHAEYYNIGTGLKDQSDFFGDDEVTEICSDLGQRSYSVLVFLNDVEEGGEIYFPKINRTITSKKGRMLIWNNLYKDGTVNDHSIYRHSPVIQGSKTVIKKYFRTQKGLPVSKRLEKENVPNYTKVGFEKDTLPKPLYNKILQFYRDTFDKQVKETVAEKFIKHETPDITKSSLIQLPESIQDEIKDCLKPILEVWSGLKLEPTFVYGIRVYHEGTSLRLHRDRNGTHIIGVIINIDQDVIEDWPLRIEDNFYRQHDILLKPGEVIYYEAVRLAHGRPVPFNGKLYSNIFCHFKIADPK